VRTDGEDALDMMRCELVGKSIKAIAIWPGVWDRNDIVLRKRNVVSVQLK
jgi:hypothetical protein